MGQDLDAAESDYANRCGAAAAAVCVKPVMTDSQKYMVMSSVAEWFQH